MSHISILGTGVVGQTLAAGFLKHGHMVVFGTAHPTKVMEWKDPSLKDVLVLSYEEAADKGELIVLTVKGTAAEGVVKAVAAKIAGKTVIDTTNPIADTPPANGVLSYFTTLGHSLMERLQTLAPDAKFVKAFNSVGNALMVNPALADKPSMFICGNDDAAKKTVTDILTTFGWEAEDMGTAEAARAIEPLCMLWCIPGFLRNDWMHAFKVLRP